MSKPSPPRSQAPLLELSPWPLRTRHRSNPPYVPEACPAEDDADGRRHVPLPHHAPHEPDPNPAPDRQVHPATVRLPPPLSASARVWSAGVGVSEEHPPPVGHCPENPSGRPRRKPHSEQPSPPRRSAASHPREAQPPAAPHARHCRQSTRRRPWPEAHRAGRSPVGFLPIHGLPPAPPAVRPAERSALSSRSSRSFAR